MAMNDWTRLLEVDLAGPGKRQLLLSRARQRNWGLALLLTGWLHLGAFALCYYLTIVQHYHDAPGYLSIWIGELGAVWLIFRCCGDQPTFEPPLLEVFLRRVWIGYFVLAFNLGTLNTLRGHVLFELFPAIASLASFAFLIMSLAVSGRFFAAVLIMFASGLLMAANLAHAYIIFAFAWWLVLNVSGAVLWLDRRRWLTAPACTSHLRPIDCGMLAEHGQ